MKLPKLNPAYLPPIIAGLCMGLAASQIYWHNLWAAAGLVLASLSWFVVHQHAQFINKLLAANRIMSDSMHRLVHDLQEAGFEVRHVETDGDVEQDTVKLIRKDFH